MKKILAFALLLPAIAYATDQAGEAYDQEIDALNDLAERQAYVRAYDQEIQALNCLVDEQACPQ